MAGIFISYRRDESRHAAGRLADDLSQTFGAAQIFRDIEGIELGTDFATALENALAACSVMLVLIGPQWLDMPDRQQGGRRLDRADDWIRQEIATALRRNVRVVPVLLEGARLPAAAELPAEIGALAGRQAMELSDARWRGDLQRLVDALSRLPGLKADRPSPPADRRPAVDPAATPGAEPGAAAGAAPGAGRKKLWWGVGLALLAVGLAQVLAEGPGPAEPVAPAGQPGLPSGYGMQTCACLNTQPAPFAPEARCASGQVRMNFCSSVCPTGQQQVAYVCR